MKILNQINYIGGLGADRWIGEGFKAAFEDLGHEFYWLTSTDDLNTRLSEVGPDILMIGQDMLTRRNVPALKTFRKEGMKVVVRVDSFFDHYPEVKDSLVHDDPADIYYGETEDPWMDHFKQMTGKEYHIITNAAHHRLHFPTRPVEKYKCDIVFLGAMMPNKKEALKLLLLPLKKKYRVLIYGPNWTSRDYILKVLARASRELSLKNVSTWFSRLRIIVPPEEENQLYSSAKICVNIHERAEHIKSHVVFNERTFKIPACGGFEICDFVPPLRRYFDESEMVMADMKGGDWVADWFQKIGYYLNHEAERKAIQERGTARALRDHTYLNRAKQMVDLYRQIS